MTLCCEFCDKSVHMLWFLQQKCEGVQQPFAYLLSLVSLSWSSKMSNSVQEWKELHLNSSCQNSEVQISAWKWKQFTELLRWLHPPLWTSSPDSWRPSRGWWRRAIGCLTKTCFWWKKSAQPALQVFGGCFEGIQKDFSFWQLLGGAQVISVLTCFTL